VTQDVEMTEDMLTDEMIPEAASRRIDDEVVVKRDEYGAKDYSQILKLKRDYQARPLYVVSEMSIPPSNWIITSLSLSFPLSVH
jgi:hypothetical protein